MLTMPGSVPKRPGYSPLADSGFNFPANIALGAKSASSLLSITISPADRRRQMWFPFADGSGTPVWKSSPNPLSINTVATGATLGSANSAPFRIWSVVFNNNGILVPALFQSVTGGATPTAIAALNESIPASTTPISGSATSAGVFYTPSGITLTNKYFRIVGFVDYGSALTTAGTYASDPTSKTLFGPGIPRPGQETGNIVRATQATVTSTTSTSYIDTALTAPLSPTSSPNLVSAMCNGGYFQTQTASGNAIIQLLGGATQLAVSSCYGQGQTLSGVSMRGLHAPGTTSPVTYKVQLKSQSGQTCTFADAAANGGVVAMELREIMV